MIETSHYNKQVKFKLQTKLIKKPNSIVEQKLKTKNKDLLRMSLVHQLTREGEFRYIVLWFSEWSEYEKIDFLPIIVQWLLKPNEPTNTIIMNGLTNSMASSSMKPMSLFQCRVSIFYSFCDVRFNYLIMFIL